MVDKYFDIEKENRLARTIRTQPQMGATLLEPWALDSSTAEDRLEVESTDHPPVRHHPRRSGADGGIPRESGSLQGVGRYVQA